MSTLTQERGEEFAWIITFTQNGTQLDATGGKINFAIRKSIPAGTIVSDADAIIAKSTTGGTITIVNGVGLMPMLAADTKALEFDPPSDRLAYIWGVELWMLGDTGPRAIDDGSGAYIITADVVRA